MGWQLVLVACRNLAIRALAAGRIGRDLRRAAVVLHLPARSLCRMISIAAAVSHPLDARMAVCPLAQHLRYIAQCRVANNVRSKESYRDGQPAHGHKSTKPRNPQIVCSGSNLVKSDDVPKKIGTAVAIVLATTGRRPKPRPQSRPDLRAVRPVRRGHGDGARIRPRWSKPSSRTQPKPRYRTAALPNQGFLNRVNPGVSAVVYHFAFLLPWAVGPLPARPISPSPGPACMDPVAALDSRT